MMKKSKKLNTKPISNIGEPTDVATLLHQQDELCQAKACLGKNTRSSYNSARPHLELGRILAQSGNHEEAARHFRLAVGNDKNSAEAYLCLGSVLYIIKEYEQAIDCFAEVIRIQPDSAVAHYNLGAALIKTNKIYQAIKSFQQAIALLPNYALALTGLGNALIRVGEYRDSELCLKRALEINPYDSAAYYSLGLALVEQNRLSEAISCYKKALELNPSLDCAFSNLGNILLRIGNIIEAISFYQKAMELKPDSNPYHSNLLLALHYSRHFTPDEIHTRHLEWSAQHALPSKVLSQSHTHDLFPDRKIRIGYVSPDFADHPVSYFIEPLLTSHNRSDFKVFCYSDVKRPDNVTERLKNHADAWREIFEASDQEVFELIRKDKIDILVDLAGHTAGNRMIVFARKPSPLQVAYLGYPDTTGLETMDYRITDAYADPPGMTDYLHSEKLVRLTHGFLCYQPFAKSPGIGKLPSLEQGHVTFGSFNNRAKITPEMVQLWAEIMTRVPTAELIIKIKYLSDSLTRRFLLDILEQNHMPMDRVKLHDHYPSKEEHLDLYNRIDVALDTFPYNGTCTTCDALWMGVPVITLKGETHVSRTGFSILSVIGLQEFTAGSEKEYIEKAVDLAADIERLRYLRSNLRTMMNSSHLMNARSFTRDLEHEYRKMWIRWCTTGQEDIPLGNTGRTQVLALIQRGEELFRSGDIDQALMVLQQADAIAPGDVRIMNDLGVIHWHTGDIDRAFATFTQVLKIDPCNDDAAFNMREMKESMRCSK